jgi:hypothetical protein
MESDLLGGQPHIQPYRTDQHYAKDQQSLSRSANR